MRRLLVTGFGPFPRVPRNPSAELALRVAADRRWLRRRVEARALVLETAYSAIGETLLPAIRDFAPHAVLMLGVAPRRRRATPETRAINRASRLYPDTSGAVGARALHLEKAAPPVRRSRVPIDALVRLLRAGGAPAAPSRDAGRYLCNAAYFAALGESEAGAAFACAFVHVPLASAKPVRRDAAGAPRPTPRGLHPGAMNCSIFLLNNYKYYR